MKKSGDFIFSDHGKAVILITKVLPDVFALDLLVLLFYCLSYFILFVSSAIFDIH